MFIGRPISAVAGLLLLVLLSRLLSKDEYGIYFAVWAMAEIIILASNLGLMSAVYRYVSSNEVAQGGIIIEGPVWQFVGMRLLFLALGALAVVYCGQLLSLLISPYQVSEVISLCIVIIVVSEGLARFGESVFDAILCQGRSQLTLIGRTCFRLVGVLVCFSVGKISIDTVIYIEAAATSLAAMVSVLMLLQLSLKSRKLAVAHAVQHDEKPSALRMFKFAAPAYLSQILSLVYGPDMLKLVLGGAVGPALLANFGFAYSLAAVVQRYMPANLLAGVFRPAFVAASKKSEANHLLGCLVSVCIKINMLFVIPFILCSIFSSNEILGLLSHGKYADAGLVLSIILLGLAAIAIHLVISLYCLAIEKSLPIFFASLASAICLPLAISIAKQAGAVGIAIVFALSEVVWCLIAVSLLIKWRAWISMEYRHLLKLVSCAVLVWCGGLLLQWLAMPWFIITALMPVLFIATCWLANIFDATERDWFCSLFPFLGRVLRSHHA